MEHYTLRIASLQDGNAIWQVMNTCREHLTDKSYFICDTLPYVMDILTNSGFAIVACDPSENIVGSLLVKYPGTKEENLGYDLSFNSDKLSKVVHMDSCCVLPKARGNHLEVRMISYAEDFIDPCNYSYLMATVAPGNTPSMKSLTKLGYQVMLTKEKYEGKLRNILMKKI